ncbi:ketoacyl-ACP synthase III [bacterium]|nr:ketoacyl-ACP synthase III [bacterium]MBU1637192.1 ketoacyl-ACP synthase III [bacterium]
MTEVFKGTKPAARIAGTGHSVPDKILSNADLEKIVDTSDEWITTRTGIKERRMVSRGEKTSDYCIRAARQALNDAQVDPIELDLIILATISGDLRFPATALIVQNAIGAKKATAWDVSATCSGFLFGLYQAEMAIACGRAKKALIIGSEFLTPMNDWTDRTTCVLFGDGAGAVVLNDTSDERGILSITNGTNGDQCDLLYCIGAGTAGSFNSGEPSDGEKYLRMNGNEVFKHAVRILYRTAIETVKLAGLEVADIDWLVPHQANIRIIQAVAERLNIPMEKVFLNIHKYGNTSSASVPIALNEARRDGIIKDGQVILSVVFGGGFTWGGAVVRF